MKAQVVSVEEIASTGTLAAFQPLHSIWQWSFAVYKENTFLETLTKFRTLQDALCFFKQTYLLLFREPAIKRGKLNNVARKLISCALP